MSYFNDFPSARTYRSDLGWLISKVTEIGQEMQSFVDFQEQIETDFEEAMQEFSTLSARVDAWQLELTDFKNDIQRQIDAQSSEIERQFLQIKADIAAELAAQLADFSEQIGNLRSYTDAQLLLNKTYVDTVIEQFIASIPDLTTIEVYNPVRNRVLTTIQTAIDDLYDVIVRVDALTADEYDSARLTAAAYDALNITAWDYDTQGGIYIEGENPNNPLWMNNPFTGIFEPIKNVVNFLAQFHMNGITAAAYDVLGLTAAAYDAKLLTAYDYDVHGVTI